MRQFLDLKAIVGKSKIHLAVHIVGENVVVFVAWPAASLLRVHAHSGAGGGGEDFLCQFPIHESTESNSSER